MAVYVTVPASKIAKRIKKQEFNVFIDLFQRNVRSLLNTLVCFEKHEQYAFAMFALKFKSKKSATVIVDVFDKTKRKYIRIANLNQKTYIAKFIGFYSFYDDWMKKTHDLAYDKAKKENPDKDIDTKIRIPAFSFCKTAGFELLFTMPEKNTIAKD